MWNINKKYLRIFIVIIVGMIILGLAYTIYRWKQNQSSLDKRVELSEKDAIVWIDKNTKTHATLEEVVFTKEEAAALYKDQLDSLAHILNIQKSQIVELRTIASRKRDTILIPIEKDTRYYVDNNCDSVYLPLSYQDSWSKLKGYATLSELYLERENWDTLKVVRYTKGALWWKKTFIDVSNSDELNKVESLRGIQISDKKRELGFSIGPSIQFGYNGSKWVPSIGVSVQYNVLKF